MFYDVTSSAAQENAHKEAYFLRYAKVSARRNTRIDVVDVESVFFDTRPFRHHAAPLRDSMCGVNVLISTCAATKMLYGCRQQRSFFNPRAAARMNDNYAVPPQPRYAHGVTCCKVAAPRYCRFAAVFVPSATRHEALPPLYLMSSSRFLLSCLLP